VDAIYGGKTEKRVQAYQQIIGVIPDALVGPETWHASRVPVSKPPLIPFTGSRSPPPRTSNIASASLQAMCILRMSVPVVITARLPGGVGTLQRETFVRDRHRVGIATA
jgi:peptidoglycan hydrolase-like protein with peptidoglycan-binding domain